jgi:chondroitin 4-sulfotransferase 11
MGSELEPRLSSCLEPTKSGVSRGESAAMSRSFWANMTLFSRSRSTAARFLWTVASPWMRRRSRLKGRAPSLYAKTGIALIKIPKTGGRSLCQALYGTQPTHWTWREIRASDPPSFRQWHKFAIVREPIARFLSAYDYLMQGGIDESDLRFAREHVMPAPNVNAFVGQLRWEKRDALLAWVHFRPQWEFVCDARSFCRVNRLVPFEHLNVYAAQLGIPELPQLNVTPGPRTEAGMLSEQSLAILRSTYARDFILYRWSKCPEDLYGRRLL